jgi:hypothetical protein
MVEESSQEREETCGTSSYVGQVLSVLAILDVFFVISGFGIFYSSLTLIGDQASHSARLGPRCGSPSSENVPSLDLMGGRNGLHTARFV